MDEIIELLIKFRDDRDWAQFQTLENLAKSISIESAELLKNFSGIITTIKIMLKKN